MDQVGLHYLLEEKNSPVWAFAIHDGHHLDTSLLPLMNLTSEERLREEDPFTGLMADIGINRLVVQSSRFQLDLNRKIEDAVYLRPEQAWNLEVWKSPPPRTLLNALHQRYHYIEKLISWVLEETIHRHGYFVVLDIHSYNARRAGRDEPIDCEKNPQLNIGTVHNRDTWKPFIESVIAYLQTKTVDGSPLDVRENVRFKGGYLSEWINARYGWFGCVLSLEFRKDFMDEWTGLPALEKIEERRLLLEDLLPFITNELQEVRKKPTTQ